MRRRSLAVAALVAATALGLTGSLPVSSAPTGDPRAEREQVRAERAAVASQIDTTKASLAEIDAALQTLEENVATQEAALARTEQEVAQAVTEVANAESAITGLTKEITVLEGEMRSRAIDAYVAPPGEDILSVLQSNDFTTASSRKFYIQLRAQDDADIADRLEGASADLAYQKRLAEEAKVRAEAKRAEQTTRTEAVRQAEAEQQQLADSIQATIDSQIARSIELADTDAALSAEIAKQQAALAARLAAVQAAQQAAARQEAADAAAAEAEANRPPPVVADLPVSNQDPSGGESTPLPPVQSSGSSGSSSSGIKLCTVGGITVNCAIEGKLQALLNAARADGLSLSGGGYRNPAAQIALRQAHCGSSSYAIYEMPASSCSPPTAKPGSSQHEIGLAIDFSNCSSRSSACYQWLAANAASFGFKNLPSEPWHWSTTGN